MRNLVGVMLKKDKPHFMISQGKDICKCTVVYSLVFIKIKEIGLNLIIYNFYLSLSILKIGMYFFPGVCSYKFKKKKCCTF